MAANCKGGAIAVSSLRKRIAGRIFAGKLVGNPNPVTRTVVARYSSTYDKNVEEQVRPAFVPDHVIGSSDKAQEEKYWGPHPKTGVFGPITTGAGADVAGARGTVASKGNGGSVLDQTAWFRPLEDIDVEKPHN